MERNGIDETSKSLFYPSIRFLVKIVKSNKDDRVLGRCVKNLHDLLLKDKSKTKDIVYYLVSMLEKISSSIARTRIIKLIMDYIDQFKTLARETFRKLVRNFTGEKSQVKFQIIQLGILVMRIDYQEENDKLEQIFSYMINLATNDADYSIKQFTRMLKGVFLKDTLCGGEITKINAFSKPSVHSNGKLASHTEYNNFDLSSQSPASIDLLGQLNIEYLPTLSCILNLNTPKSLEVEPCTSEQQELADDFNCRLAPTKDIMFAHSVFNPSENTKSERSTHSVGFVVQNAQGKVIQSLGSENIKLIEGISTMQQKHKESYAFKDKKQLKQDLENWFDDEDEEEKLTPSKK